MMLLIIRPLYRSSDGEAAPCPGLGNLAVPKTVINSKPLNPHPLNPPEPHSSHGGGLVAPWLRPKGPAISPRHALTQSLYLV